MPHFKQNLTMHRVRTAATLRRTARQPSAANTHPTRVDQHDAIETGYSIRAEAVLFKTREKRKEITCVNAFSSVFVSGPFSTALPATRPGASS